MPQVHEFNEPDWTTRAGRKLQQLADLLVADEPDWHFEVVVFGSAPISLYVDASHVSGDVDLYVSQLGGGQPDEAQVVKDCIARHGLGKGQSAFYIELTWGQTLAPLMGTLVPRHLFPRYERAGVITGGMGWKHMPGRGG